MDGYETSTHKLVFLAIAAFVFVIGPVLSGRSAEDGTGYGLGRTPTEEEIRFGIAGNICRCTGYQNIVKAIQYAAAKINGVEFQEAAE